MAQKKGKDEILMGIRYCISSLICALIFPFINPSSSQNGITIILAVGAGILEGLLMLYTRKALSLNCSSIAIAILNSSCIVPHFCLSLIFGKEFNFHYTWMNALGAFCVSLGFILEAKQLSDKEDFPVIIKPNGTLAIQSKMGFSKIKILSFAFLLQIAYLFFLQWKSLNFKQGLPKNPLLPFQGLEEGGNFYTIMLFTCAIFQWLNAPTFKVKLSIKEIGYFGILGGIANGFAGLFLFLAIQFGRTPLENALMYPFLSIGTVCFSQVWTRWIYQEQIPWKALLLLFIGILLNAAF